MGNSHSFPELNFRKLSVLLSAFIQFFFLQMMKFAWDNYKQYALGKNELRPLTKNGHIGNMFGEFSINFSAVSLPLLKVTCPWQFLPLQCSEVSLTALISVLLLFLWRETFSTAPRSYLPISHCWESHSRRNLSVPVLYHLWLQIRHQICLRTVLKPTSIFIKTWSQSKPDKAAICLSS